MTSYLRVAMDMQVVVSAALLRRSKQRQVFDRVPEHGAFLMSSGTVAELAALDVLRHSNLCRGRARGHRASFSKGRETLRSLAAQPILTRVCRRRSSASACTSLRLPGVPDAL